jgi:hypothetical protein
MRSEAKLLIIGSPISVLYISIPILKDNQGLPLLHIPYRGHPSEPEDLPLRSLIAAPGSPRLDLALQFYVNVPQDY